MKKNICGDRIKIARSRKKIKQIDIAVALEEHKIYLNQTAVGKIERGERNIYDCEIRALSDILEVYTHWLIRGGDLKID